MFDDIPLPSRKMRDGVFNLTAPGKSTAYAILFALLFGGIAGHRFYLRKLGTAVAINLLNIVGVLILIPLFLDGGEEELLTALTTGQMIGLFLAIAMMAIAGFWVFVDLIVLFVVLIRESF
ncbi:NINE protein [Pseudovibrio sp. Tun.PSC04-5.I4]|uniref:NINE protein n=1 Tax=Pseudovibrio sp. Tun.PSC04-5.I4 TaxID=1798213 RepID=UPI000883A0FC|nr:NINE protein [Pseudovibrio sp. Tun.PSC04-5.I4]SDR27761.1 TM2 domain-containing protein [Pseudovibrio sp. Tun.PSC04-5.I4]